MEGTLGVKKDLTISTPLSLRNAVSATTEFERNVRRDQGERDVSPSLVFASGIFAGLTFLDVCLITQTVPFIPWPRRRKGPLSERPTKSSQVPSVVGPTREGGTEGGSTKRETHSNRGDSTTSLS